MRQLSFLSIVIFLLCLSLGCQQKAEEATSQPEATQASGSEDAELEGSESAEPSETDEAQASGTDEAEPKTYEAAEALEAEESKGARKEADEPVAVAQGEENDTEYHFVPPSELEFSIEDMHYNAMVGESGTAVPVGGEIGKLLCNGKPIELASKEFDDGHIVTKDFGRVKILFSSSLTQSGMAIYLTNKQKKAISDYAPKQ